MPKQVEFNGVIHDFPDDATDAEIAAALEDRQPIADRGVTIGPQTMNVAERGLNAMRNAGGIPGVLAGAVGEVMNSAASGGDLLRRGWNAVMPGVLDVSRPNADYQPIPATDAYQQLGMRGMQAAEVLGGIGRGPGIVARGAGVSKARAGENLEAVRERVNLVSRMNPEQGVRVSGHGAQQAVGRAQELRAVGAYTPASVTRLARRLESGGDLSFQEASDFASRFSQLSADEMSKMTPQMAKQIKEIAGTLRAGLQDAADAVGRGAQYEKGISEYGRAKRLEDAWKKAWPLIKKGLIGGAAAQAGWRGWQSLAGDQ